MKSMEITAVGIDVSKRKSTVAIRRPGGVIVACPFDISHSSHDLEKLVSILKTTGGDIRVVMEHTSNYWKPIALTLKNAGFYVSVVNAMLIHDFSDNSIRKLKTDRADSLKIANYALTFWNQLPPFNDEDETRLVLKEQSRMYERLASTATSLRNGLIALADQTFPSIDQAFGHADWCGLIQVDLDLNLWTPFWWFNAGATDKTMLLTEEYESAEFLDRWVQTVRKGIPMVVPDAEATKEAYPAEYNLYQRLGIRSVIAVSLEPRPVALLAVRNPKRYIQQTSMLRILAYVLLASYNEQKMLNRLQMAYIPTSIQSSKDIYVSLFGELSISTSKGVLKEADFSSPRISRLISYLLISRKNAISPQEITQTLWPDDLDNPAKNVKGLIYRLRQKFNLISDEPLILSSASGYQLNPELHIMTDYQRFDELVSSAVRASSIINKVDILKNALDLYHGKVLSSADGEHWLIQFSTKYHLSYMGAVSELLKQLDSLHSYDLLNQYAMKSLTIAPDNPKAYCWLIRSLKAQGMNELATNELAAAKEHLTTEEYEEILAFGANW